MMQEVLDQLCATAENFLICSSNGARKTINTIRKIFFFQANWPNSCRPSSSAWFNSGAARLILDAVYKLVYISLARKRDYMTFENFEAIDLLNVRKVLNKHTCFRMPAHLLYVTTLLVLR